MRRTSAGAILAVLLVLAGCTGRGPDRTAEAISNMSERECLARAMYFESNRSSGDGLMAVGTVVMNRVASPSFPNTICGGVSQPGQFAHGVITRPLDRRQLPAAEAAADRILAGERYAPVGNAMHFHMASYKNPYPAQYVAVAGGNAFYLKPSRRRQVTTTGAVTKPPLVQTLRNATSIVAGGQSAPPCESETGFGATSLACETDIEGR